MPRTTRIAKSADLNTEPTPPPAKPKPPKCARCGHELDWRDRFYAPTPKKPADADNSWTPPPPLCKTCQQHGRRKRLGVVAFHPAVAMVERGKKIVEVPVRFNRAARRGHGAASTFDAQIAPRPHKRTRAERRAAARKAAATVAA